MIEQPPVGAEEGDESSANGSGDVITITGNFINSTVIVKSVVKDKQVPSLEKLPAEPGDPPYQGLQYFSEKDADRFFGREQLTARVIGRFQRTRFLAVIGASGSGKSSLVRAGIVPTLKSGKKLTDGSLPPSGSTHWTYRVFTPDGHPLEALAAALSKENALTTYISSLRNELAADPKSLGLAAQGLLSQVNSQRLFLVIDQFEEIFTQTRINEEREAFINAIVAASKPDDVQPVSILVCLRADFYAQVAQHDQLRELISQHQEFICAMNQKELVDAIVAPLVQGDWKIQEGLVKVILRDVGYEPGALPLLSHALLETWKKRRGRTLTLSGYEESGGVYGAIRETADTVFKGRLTEEQQLIARLIFLHLVELGEDAHDTRRRAPFSELITRSTDEKTIQTVIDILADARLVITNRVEPGNTKVVEVAHESLIREWPTLREWLNKDRQGLILHRQLTEAAEDWVENERESGLLIRGRRLEQIQEWFAKESNAEMLSLQEIEFLEASQANALIEAEKESGLARARRTQRIFGALILSLLVLVAVLGYTRLQPPKMNGLYNVAVADIGMIDPDGQVRRITDGSGTAISQDIASQLQSAFQKNPDILIWNNSPELRLQRVRIRTLESNSPEQLTQAAEDLATRLNADMVIYGVLDQRQQPHVLNLQMYLVPRLEDALDEVKGSFALNAPIAVNSDLGSDSVKAEITRQANLLAMLVRAQFESKAGRNLEALDSYLNAAELAPDSDLLQFFVARESLFITERKAVPQSADEAFEGQAFASLEKALELNPQNARAYIGLGSLYMKQARRLVVQARDSEFTDQNFQQVMKLLDQAETAYGQVSQLDVNPAEYGVPVLDLARLGLGNARLLRGTALQEYSQFDPTTEAFTQAVQIFNEAAEMLKATLPAFQAPNLGRYLAQNYLFLGSAYQSTGYLAYVAGDPSTAVQAYEQSIEQFNACIKLGENSADRIIQVDIVEAYCLPGRQETEELLQALSGGS